MEERGRFHSAYRQETRGLSIDRRREIAHSYIRAIDERMQETFDTGATFDGLRRLRAYLSGRINRGQPKT